jgi:signal transduction histidine kinase
VFRSLRFRLPALFLLAIALSGLVASLIAIGLFQDYTRDRAIGELRREARGIAQLHAELAPRIGSSHSLELATGDRLFWVGVDDLPLEDAEGGAEGRAITQLKPGDVPVDVFASEQVGPFEFTPPGEERTLIAASHRLRFEDDESVFGAIIAARPTTELRERWVILAERLAVAFLGGVFVAGALGWYLSRRITAPVLALSRAADEVAEGRYDVQIPELASGDEIAHLADRFDEMTTRLREGEEVERNFLMTVSHELRTPLTAIRGHVEALREGVVEDAELTAASLDVIAAETGRLERLVGDVLDLARLDAHRFTVLREEVDMRRLVDQAYASFEQEARRREIDYRLAARADAVITTDGDRVLQIVSNLVTNAFRWTPDGGRIAIELDARDGRVSVAVEDSGPGISPEARDRIFRPFWSLDGGGTGLGLAIARELAHALGGQVELESTPGRGSRFLLVLPAESPPAVRDQRPRKRLTRA